MAHTPGSLLQDCVGLGLIVVSMGEEQGLGSERDALGLPTQAELPSQKEVLEAVGFKNSFDSKTNWRWLVER